jgi:hypothetical protein
MIRAEHVTALVSVSIVLTERRKEKAPAAKHGWRFRIFEDLNLRAAG